MLTTEFLIFFRKNFFRFFEIGQFQECPKSKFWKKFVKQWKNRCEHHAHSADSVFSVLLLTNVFHSQFLFSNFDEERVANTKNEKCNWLWKTWQKSTVSIMLRNHFFAENFCYWGFVIHSQFLFSNFDEERVANAKNEKCNWLWITNWALFDHTKRVVLGLLKYLNFRLDFQTYIKIIFNKKLRGTA